MSCPTVQPQIRHLPGSFAIRLLVRALAVAAVLSGCDGDVGLDQRTVRPPAGYPVDHHIVIDQFGYRPRDPKVAVIRNPRQGFDSADTIAPGTTFQLRRVSDGVVVMSAAPVRWNAGAVQESSGDQGWWFDFSAFREVGRYFVYDADRKVRSPAFVIDDKVYKDVLKAAMRTFLYQRSGIRKAPPQAAACWADDAAYLGRGQDSQARNVNERDNPAAIRDLRGGWFDAGDTSKYVTFASPAVHQLLSAFAQNPAAFTDDFNIPESGNGIPDLLDEVRWETDWLKRMQFGDGSVALKVGEVTYEMASPPSSNHSPRFYVPACTSATIAAAGMFAHASYRYAQVPGLAQEAADLKSRAVRAWENFRAAPAIQADCDAGVVKAGDADLTPQDQLAEAVVAAVYLYAITGDHAFEDHIRLHYRELRPFRDMGWSRYNAQQGEALLFFAALPGADSALSKAILADKLADVRAGNGVYGFAGSDDLYRAYLHDAQYHWGSNQPRANYGNTNLDAIRYLPGLTDVETYRVRALEILHYFHGVNPFGMVYLSNMYSYGATRSVNEIYHTWFQQGTKWSSAIGGRCGPPPGFVPGGPNVNAAENGVPTSLSPPTGQPAQKSYRDWNGNWPESSWAVTEPAIYYQASYVKLVSAFVE